MSKIIIDKHCFHCGDQCTSGDFSISDKVFCCLGCERVYSLLHSAEMENYYCLNDAPGISVKDTRKDKFSYLEHPEIINSLISFRNQEYTTVTFFVPQMHCSSCLWLLENLYRLHLGLMNSHVNFPSKNLTLSFNHELLSLRQVVELLSSIGYEPAINQEQTDKQSAGSIFKKNALKIGISGFCFANIMLVSLPEYLGLNHQNDEGILPIFRFINLGLALPVLIVGGKDFFVSAWHSLRQRYINIDLPIALAIAVTFIRSVIEILSGTGPGFLDTMAGIIFFMLIGRALQNRTYSHLKFNRDYKSYFPIAATLLKNGQEQTIMLHEIAKDDILRLHHDEIVPVDCILSKGRGEIDYSFITGESVPQPVAISEVIYSGGKVSSTAIEVVAINNFVQNSFTRLWNNEIFNQESVERNLFVERLNKYFSIIVLAIALSSFIYWQAYDITRAWNALTAILIIACPCALLLASSFTYGFLLEVFSDNGFYVKNSAILNRLNKIDHIVLDKTGTLTVPSGQSLRYEGIPLPDLYRDLVYGVMEQSIHPLSRAIVSQMKPTQRFEISDYKEEKGRGIVAWYEEILIKIGSPEFLGVHTVDDQDGSAVYVSVDHKLYGSYRLRNILRPGIGKMIADVSRYQTSLLSGDNDNSSSDMRSLLGSHSEMVFNCSPLQKLEYVRTLQESGKKVLMVGDGLNDAGALRQSDVGVSVVDDKFAFSPACGAVLDATKIQKLGTFLKMSRQVKNLIIVIFIYSIIYNIIGLSFAIRGVLEPVLAAIIMPLSSISIILVSFISIKYLARKNTMI